MTRQRHPRVAFDARLAIGAYRGMGRFARRMIAPYASEFIALTADGERDGELNVAEGGYRFYPLWEQWSLPKLAQRHRADYLFCPYNTAPLRLPKETRLILAVHDLIFLEPRSRLPLSNSLYQNVGRLYRRWVVPRVLPRAEHIVTVSEYTRHCLERYAPGIAEKVTVIPNTIDANWFRAALPEQRRVPYVLCPSGEAPSKNLSCALEAFARLRAQAPDVLLDLVVTGVKPAFHASFQQKAVALGCGEGIHFESYLPESRLRSLYAGAACCWVPSLYEGFGIPLLEAMANGVPLLCSDIEVFREVAGDAAIYFDPRSPESMGWVLARVANDRGLRESLRSAAVLQVARYHPDCVDGQIERFWEQIFHGDSASIGAGTAVSVSGDRR